MSIRNDRTGRHEDDLASAAYLASGTVDLREVLAHLDECVVGCGFGSNVEDAVATLTTYVRALALAGQAPRFGDEMAYISPR